MKIGIVTPSYNQGQFIRETIDSVLKQSYTDVDYVIMDGGSTDTTHSILESIDDPRLTWTSEADNGQSDAINKGMRVVKGDILAYLNSDDVYLPDTFRYVVDFFTENPDVDILYGCVHAIDAQSNYLGKDYVVAPITLDRLMTRRFKFPQQAVFWRRCVMEEIGLFDEGLHFQMDFDYWVRAWFAGFKFAPTDKFLANFREHDDSKSISQAVKFWQDWQTIIDRIYARDDLSSEVRQLEGLARNYVDHYAAEGYIKYGDSANARPHLRRILGSRSASVRLRTVSLARLIDTCLNTPFALWLNRLDLMLKGKRS